MGRKSYTQKRDVSGLWCVFGRVTLLVRVGAAGGVGGGREWVPGAMLVFGPTARGAAWLLRFALQIAVVDIYLQYSGYGLGYATMATGVCGACIA